MLDMVVVGVVFKKQKYMEKYKQTDKSVKMSEQLKTYLETTSSEQQEKDWFEVCCRVNGIDPDSPNAKFKLRWINFKNKYWYPIYRKRNSILYGSVSVLNMMCAGMNFYREICWLALLNFITGMLFLCMLYSQSKKEW